MCHFLKKGKRGAEKLQISQLNSNPVKHRISYQTSSEFAEGNSETITGQTQVKLNLTFLYK